MAPSCLSTIEKHASISQLLRRESDQRQNQKDGVSTASATARDLERTYDQPQPSTSSQCLTFSVPAPEQLEPQPRNFHTKIPPYWKGLIGVAPNGVITYISGLYPGSTSDKKIVQHCGILDQLAAGDLILANKGFLIRDILPPGVMLNLPPFLTTAQFTPQQ
ncbi:hypothetical protein JTB14_030812 [Gonioctena quinquepunctata]|nr:hypothetical protein JTB14_030812 [Gonioctena quinquepunctata]